jgi:cellulose synthase/poly-beta-1,6-N-acetylglucosamine synthase-like glycosyltransferase
VIVSVIIPTVSSPRQLAPLLHSLREQIFDGSFEVIVVDDVIDQRRAAELDGLSFRTDQCECRVVHGEGKGPARARNLGVEQAKGAYLLFLDDDVRVDRGYLGRVFQELSARPRHAVSGTQTAIDRRNCFSLAAEWLLTVFSEGESTVGPLSKFAPSNGLALRRSDFQKCGGFDPRFPLAAGEDREFSTRWIAAGFHIIVLKEAAVEHHFPKSFLALMKQQWRYGRGTFHYQARVPPSHAPRIRRMPFYLRMIAQPSRQYGLPRGALIGALCALSQGMIACGYLRERIWPSLESPAGLNDGRA